MLCALVELLEEKAVLKYEEWEKRQYVLREGYHIANHNHHKLATIIRKRLKRTELWARQRKEDLRLYENFRQYILEAREIVEKRKAGLATLRAKRSRRTAKHHEKITKTLSCPRCGATLVCPSCGLPRKM